jgi:hypothetical protein
MGIKTVQNFTLILKLWRKMREICQQKSYKQKQVQNGSHSSSILLTSKSFWKITFSGCTFSQLFPRI